MTKEQEEAIEIFEGLKRNKEIIKDIDKDYFFTFAETIINLVQEQQRENEKKEKMIDEMATTLSEVCTGITVVINQFEKRYCEFLNSDEDCCWKTDTDCSYCIKQYFENQAKM